MTVELFSAAWASAWREEIDRSAAFRSSGAAWDGSLVLRMTQPAGASGGRAPAVLVDLRAGICRAARGARTTDEDGAGFVIEADGATWRDLFAGRADLVFSIIRGRFKLVRGTLAELMPHLRAAKDLLDAAGRIDAYLPAERSRL